MDLLELTFYQKILPALIQFETENTKQESELAKCFPKFYAGHSQSKDQAASGDGDFYLILENVCSRHFKLADCNLGLDIDTASLMVKKVRKMKYNDICGTSYKFD